MDIKYLNALAETYKQISAPQEVEEVYKGKMDRGTRADLEYRKANLKKEELEATGLFTAEEIERILDIMCEDQFDEADSIDAMRERAAKRRQQRYGKQGGGGRDDFRPYTKADYERGEANDPRKKK